MRRTIGAPMLGTDDAPRLDEREAKWRTAWPARLAGLASEAARGREAARWRDRATRGAALLTLLVAVGLTVAAWRLVEVRERQAARIELETRVTQTVSRLTARMQAYEQMLRGGAALVASVGPIGRGEWRSFVRTLAIDALPDIEAMGWAPYVPQPTPQIPVRRCWL